VYYLKEHYRRQKNGFFFFQVKHEKKEKKREMWEEKKMKKTGCPSHTILKSQNVLLNYDAFPCTWALHYTFQLFFLFKPYQTIFLLSPEYLISLQFSSIFYLTRLQ
jgi:hypothetical protein